MRTGMHVLHMYVLSSCVRFILLRSDAEDMVDIVDIVGSLGRAKVVEDYSIGLGQKKIFHNDDRTGTYSIFPFYR